MQSNTQSNKSELAIPGTSLVKRVQKFGTPVTNSPWFDETGLLVRDEGRAFEEKTEAVEALATAPHHAVAVLLTL
jgi:hypothetical protein